MSSGRGPFTFARRPPPAGTGPWQRNARLLRWTGWLILANVVVSILENLILNLVGMPGGPAAGDPRFIVQLLIVLAIVYAISVAVGWAALAWLDFTYVRWCNGDRRANAHCIGIALAMIALGGIVVFLVLDNLTPFTSAGAAGRRLLVLLMNGPFLAIGILLLVNRSNPGCKAIFAAPFSPSPAVVGDSMRPERPAELTGHSLGNDSYRMVTRSLRRAGALTFAYGAISILEWVVAEASVAKPGQNLPTTGANLATLLASLVVVLALYGSLRYVHSQWNRRDLAGWSQTRPVAALMVVAGGLGLLGFFGAWMPFLWLLAGISAGIGGPVLMASLILSAGTIAAIILALGVRILARRGEARPAFEGEYRSSDPSPWAAGKP